MRQYTLDEFRSGGSGQIKGTPCPTCGDRFDSQHGMRIHHAHAHSEKLRDTIICETCGAEFEESVNSTDEQYCSPECQKQGLRERVELECEICGASFDVPPSMADKRVTCGGAECRSTWRSAQTGEDAFAYRGGKVELECEICGSGFKVFPHETDSRTTCGSPDCVSEWNSRFFSGDNHPNWKGGKTARNCPICGEQYEEYPSDHEIYQTCRSEECKRRYQSRMRSGPNHPRWKGGGSRTLIRKIKDLLTNDGTWQSFANEYREAGESHCEHCGRSSTETGRSFSVHHIVPIRAGGCHADDLLMTLCDSCHPMVEAYTNSIPEITPTLPDQEELNLD